MTPRPGKEIIETTGRKVGATRNQPAVRAPKGMVIPSAVAGMGAGVVAAGVVLVPLVAVVATIVVLVFLGGVAGVARLIDQHDAKHHYQAGQQPRLKTRTTVTETVTVTRTRSDETYS